MRPENLNFLFSFVIFNKFVNKMVKIAFFFLKKGTIFESRYVSYLGMLEEDTIYR